ncbi:ABC-F family ATP-binding cassette domain-containing protein [Salipaludibacillus sp. LMS25]|jgi:ATP-binding cassette subfamily F protein 3|uniref:ABC-F family ATP-binding cassette domain-containing protein n=1 Tax=Salipaludibacillus sp. LMS25 TaxID=2924031 RepID=UPI0020D11555|nr:ABC-F family ATP-binding cassette domain-containing protein [Salipaludibacillus sp. LMS25]UTR13438.1 ABC-F family ATP-binding cassette domain-containing protein [Salipaludibacillus sp. LMS25]
MILLQCTQLSKSFGTEKILSDVKLEIKSRERIALVGRNGAGKSTLLKILTGELSYDSGQIVIPKDVSIGYLAQNSGLHTERSIWDEMMTVFEPLRRMEASLRTLEEKMSHPSQKDHDKILQEYDQLQQDFKDKGGFQYEADTRSILSGLNFNHFDYNTPISSLSGGQKTRLSLGKLLLSKPDLLILDEPTNHLDIATLTWLEQYLSGYDGAVLIVSHDRYFLDKVVDYVYELSFHQTVKYTGNYSKYLEQKAARLEQEMKLYEKQQDEMKRLEEFVQKNLARASTSNRAKSRRKQLERMTVMDRPKSDDHSANFRFNIQKQSGNDVLMINDLTLGYDDNILFQQANLRLTRGESIALIGPNGIGKSTLIKAIAGKHVPLHGKITYGSNVTIGYYDQEQTELTSNKTVLQELWDDYPETNEKDIRTVLGNFLFSGEDVLKIVYDLSGGEKARLALAKLMMQKANLLILDEPTNHLDLDSKEVLENALIEYPGTLLFVSHDRYFVNRMATRVTELSEAGMMSYLGDYDYYAAKKAEQAELQRLKESETANNHTFSNASEKTAKSDYVKSKEQQKLARQRQRRIEKVEQAIEENELTISQLEEALCDPAIFQDHEKVADLHQQLEAAKHTFEGLMEEWEVLQLEE